MAIINGLAFSVEILRRDADEIEACGGGNEAACMRWAADEIERLRALLRAVGEPDNPPHSGREKTAIT